MLADFTIVIHSDPERSVQVKIHDDLRALRSAATRFTRSWRDENDIFSFAETLGICHRFTSEGSSLCAIVRLTPPHVGSGMVAHELAHAAVWIHELDAGEEVPLLCSNDEQFCWTLGELVRQTTTKLYEHGVYEIS